MAFNPSGGNIPTELGSELPDVFTDDVGFKGVSGDSNVQLLPTPWPADALPAPTSSLLAIASTKGIVVGAGPESLAISSSEAVRKAISAPTGEEKVKTKAFQPQATIPLPARPTHVTFASGDSALVLATENGAQLSVFETASLLQGNAQPALSVPTNGATFRAVVPNPSPSSDAHSTLVALITVNGELLIADLKGGNLVAGPNGQILKTGVSSVCWSNKGKQLVAGLGDGTGYQMTPDGAQKDLIPRPPDLEGECHSEFGPFFCKQMDDLAVSNHIPVSSISWLENDIFLMVYTPNSVEDDMGQNPPSSYYIITRRKQGPFLIQKMPELCGPFGFKRTPAYQFIARLRDYKPHLKDVLIVSSTASTDVGLITRADKPLSNEDAAKGTVNLFTTTEVSDDTKRACLPLKDSVDETSVVGLGIDLSSTEKVVSPIQGEDILESSTPLPNILLLNNDGILSSWWFVYSEAIRQNVPYHGLASVNQQPQQTQPQPQPQPAPQSAFGKSSFGSSSALGATSPFGKPSATPGFGSPSALGASPTPSFGKPSFGTPSGMGGFGQPSALGQSKPAFGTSSFGQPSTPGKGLGSIGFNASSGGGFGSFANAGGSGFGSFAAAKPSGESPFGKTTTPNPFGKPSVPSPFGAQTDTNTAFPPQNIAPKGPAPTSFQLGSTFKGDGSAVNDAPKPEKPSGGFFSLDTSLDEMVSTPAKTSPPAESMDDSQDGPVAEQPPKPATPPSLFNAPSKTDTPAQPPTSLFGPQNQPQQASPAAQANKPFSLFGNMNTQNQISSPLSAPSEKTAVPSPTPPKEQPKDVQGTPVTEPEEPPLPPDPTSRAVYGPGDTSASSNVSRDSIEEAPLPPDFTTKPKSVPKEAGGEPPLPPDFAAKPKKPEDTKTKAEEAPLPPEPATPASIAGPPEESSPVPDESDTDEAEKEADEEIEELEKKAEVEAEKEAEEEEEEEEEESENETGDEEEESDDFADSGEDITHDVSHTEELQSPKTSLESSFGDKSPAGGLFTRISKPDDKKKPSQQLFGEVSKPFFPPTSRANQEPPRSPSPVRAGAQKGPLKLGPPKSFAASQGPGDALAARKAALKESRRDSQLKDIAAQEEQARLHAEAQRQEEEALSLSDDDEDERLRADLSQPLEPVPTLDPFLPHQDYSGETTKPGIPGQIERLYRDINSMVDTLGINARSLASFLLYQKSPQEESKWVDTLNGDNPASVLDEKLLLSQIEKLDDAVVSLAGSLQQQRVQGVEEKLDSCRELLGKDILTLRGQCASIRKTLDAHVDTAAIMSAPLSAEQANLQQDLRSASTDLQAKLADLEQGVSLLRAKIADAPRPDRAAKSTKRPTVEAVTSTIATMMNMAESKSSDIDVLEVQLKRLGLDTSAPPSREGSPFTTPKKGLRAFPATPGSRGSVDGLSAYHTPDSASRGINFRSSITGSARASRLRSVEATGDLGTKQESERWRAKAHRKQHIADSLKKAIGEKKVKVRGVDDM